MEKLGLLFPYFDFINSDQGYKNSGEIASGIPTNNSREKPLIGLKYLVINSNNIQIKNTEYRDLLEKLNIYT